ncbi:MAG TPA: carbamoyl-phosphate synthase small subunit [Polyangiaceae bacterium]|nr:carbamoyl-phosphate synthase small subunit [Polyangiaceae bacterium]
MSGREATLVLADGTRFSGEAFGHDGTTVGECVFTTGMTGYQEVLTDPSYCGQLVTMTAPHIGNTGVNAIDPENRDGRPRVAGLIVRDGLGEPSSWRSEASLHDYLDRHGVVALSGIDTRSLTQHLRDKGSMNAAMGTEDPEALLRKAREAPAMEGLDLVAEVTPKEPYAWTEGTGEWRAAGAPGVPETSAEPRPGERHVVVIDLGIKRNILRCLVDVGCRVTAVPATASADEVMALKPDGIFVSNGPGDPAAVTYAVETLKELLGERPMFGICLGHQLMALAAGGSTYKLKFGHRGINQPVEDLHSGRVEITSQNHGFAVDLESLAGKAKTTHVHLNDGTSEGLVIDELDAFSVQFHPEAAGGPHDALYLFERFVTRIDEAQA